MSTLRSRLLRPFRGRSLGHTPPAHRGRSRPNAATGRGSERLGRACFEQLEARQVLAVSVTSLADDGDGSLRAAIKTVNDNKKSDSIVFTNLGTGTISLVTALPVITNPAGTAFSFSGTTVVTIDGGGTSGADGLTFDRGVNGIVMNGLNLTLQNFDSGLRFLGGSTGSLISGLTLRTNAKGIELVGGTMTGSVISGNTISANTAYGLLATGGVTGLTVGGPTPAARNNLAFNGDGLSFRSGDYTGTVVQGNSIIQNAGDGIQLVAAGGAITGLQIGGAGTAAANTSQSNGDNGIAVTQGDYTRTSIVGNLVATNDRHGIQLSPAGQTLTNLALGGKAQGNILQSNGADGIAAYGGTYTGTTVQGNAIQYNVSNGMSINLQGGGGGFTGLLVGGPDLGNTIMGNEGDGVLLNSGVFGSTALKGNVIQGNGRNGVHFLAVSGQKMQGFALGGTATGEANVIDGNAAAGIAATKADYTGTTVVGNTIRDNGVGISLTGAKNLAVGGAAANQKNTISGSKTAGLTGSGDLGGTTCQGNAFTSNVQGVSLTDAQGLAFGGAATGAGNTVTGGGTGIVAVGNLAGTSIAGNAITGQTTGIQLVNASGTAAAPFSIGGVATTVGNGVGNYVAATVHGLYATGSLNNTTIAGNVVTASTLGGTAMVLVNATGLMVGGTTAGSGNTLNAARGNAFYAMGVMRGTSVFRNRLAASVNGAVLNGTKSLMFGVANNRTLGNVVRYNRVGVLAAGNCNRSGVCFTSWFRNVRNLRNAAAGLVVFPAAP